MGSLRISGALNVASCGVAMFIVVGGYEGVVVVVGRQRATRAVRRHHSGRIIYMLVRQRIQPVPIPSCPSYGRSCLLCSAQSGDHERGR